MEEQKDNSNNLVLPIVAVIAGIALGYWFGAGAGYKKAVQDIMSAETPPIVNLSQ